MEDAQGIKLWLDRELERDPTNLVLAVGELAKEKDSTGKAARAWRRDQWMRLPNHQS